MRAGANCDDLEDRFRVVTDMQLGIALVDGAVWMGYAGWKWEDICQARIEGGIS